MFGSMFQFLSSAIHSTRHSRSSARLYLEPLEDRTLLNNRFVVPASLPVDNVTNFATLQDALTINTAGFNSGDTIQIAAGSTPGNVTGPALGGLPAGLGRLYIQGDPATPLLNIPQFTLDSPASLSAMDVTFQNVNIGLIGSGSFIFNNDSAISNSFIVNLSSTATNLITFAGTADVLANTKIINQAPITGSELLVAPTASSSNVISGNIFVTNASSKLLVDYFPTHYPTVVTDVIENNNFVGNAGTNLYGLLSTVFAIGLKVENNTFSDPDPNNIAASFQFIQNAQIIGNSVSLTGLGGRGIEIFGIGNPTTSALIDGNTSSSIAGPGLEIDVGTAPAATLNLQVQNNVFDHCQIGVLIDSAAGFPGPVGGIDLGGGNQGSLGDNNFLGFTSTATAGSGAIVVLGVATSQGIIRAHKNLFAAGVNPRNEVIDPNLNLDLGLAPAPTATTIVSNVPLGSTYGQQVTFTATVAPTSGPVTPTGTIQFLVDGSNFGVPVTLSGGAASLSIAALSAGSHIVTAVYSGDSNFQGGSSTLLGGQTVNQATLIISAKPQGMLYGNSVPPLTASYYGFVNGDTASSLTTAPTLSTTVTEFSHPGTYPITASGAVDPNYVIDYAPGVLTVVPALDTIIGRAQQTGQWWVAQHNGFNAFSNILWDTWSTAVTWVDVQTGDFNGDGKGDVAARDLNTGNWYVGLSNGSRFVTTLWANWNPNVTWVDVQTGDFNGDGKADIIGRVLQTGQWWVGRSTGASFANSLWSTWSTGATWVDVNVRDLNGDGKSDVTGRWLEGGSWWTSLSIGSSFTTSLWSIWSTAVTWVDIQVGDFNGDNKSDVAGRVLQTGQWWTGLSTGTSFKTSLWTIWSTAVTWVDVKVGDFNGDGRADIIGRASEFGQWWVGISSGSGFSNRLWSTWSTGVTWVDVQVGDFNQDGKSDVAGRVLGSGQWWAGRSDGSTFITSLWTTWSTGVTWVDVMTGRIFVS
jgi:hypothetical protein